MRMGDASRSARAHLPAGAVVVPRIRRKHYDLPRPSDPIETGKGFR